MKNFKIICTVLFTIALFSSCTKNDNITITSKNITYEVSLESNKNFQLKGSYVNEKGESVLLNEELPFKKELKNVPANVKAGFKGHLFNIATKEVIGVASITVADSKTGKEVYKDKKSLNLTKNSFYTNEELVEKTSFSFSE